MKKRYQFNYYERVNHYVFTQLTHFVIAWFIVLEGINTALLLNLHFNFIQKFGLKQHYMMKIFIILISRQIIAFFYTIYESFKTEFIIEIPNHERDVSNDFKTIGNKILGSLKLTVSTILQDAYFGGISHIIEMFFYYEMYQIICYAFEFLEFRYGFTFEIFVALVTYMYGMLMFIISFYFSYSYIKFFIILKFSYGYSLRKINQISDLQCYTLL